MRSSLRLQGELSQLCLHRLFYFSSRAVCKVSRHVQRTELPYLRSYCAVLVVFLGNVNNVGNGSP